MSTTYLLISLTKNLILRSNVCGTYVVLTCTSSTVKINGNSKTNSAKTLSS